MRGTVVAVLAWLATGSVAWADGPALEVAPTTLELTPGSPGLFYLANRGTAPVTAQIEALDWDQAAGTDRTQPSRGLFASPPLATIAPGKRQTVRVLSNETGPREIAHRLMVTQLPDENGIGGVRILLQLSVPVFVAAKSEAPALLSWTGTTRDGDIVLSVRNDGGRTAKLEGLDLRIAGNAPLPIGQGALYVVPGGWRLLVVKEKSAQDGVPAHITGHDTRSGSPVDADIVLHR